MDKRMEEFFDPDAEVEENPEYEKWFDLFAGLSNDDLAKKRSLAAEKSINGAKPTTVELALFPYLFPDAQEYHHTAVSNAQSQGNDAALQGQAPQHAPAVQAEPTPKGSGGNTRRTKHKQGLAKRLIHELFEQYPDKSGGEICGLLESQKFQLDGWRVERHVGSVTEPDNIKKDKYIIESDQGTDRVTAGTIDTWLSDYRKNVK